MTYFHEVQAKTGARLWVNNPTPEEARQSIADGAVSCTTNPAYCSRMIKVASEDTRRVIDQCLDQSDDDSRVAALVQGELVRPLLDVFRPVHEASNGDDGWVSIQGDPYQDEDSQHILEEAREYKALGPNFISKVPVIKAGLEALYTLVAENTPTIFTEVFSIDQARTCVDIYARASASSGYKPATFLTHITGIYDECLSGIVNKENIQIAPEVLKQAGRALCRKQYKIFTDEKWPGRMLGGGARETYHFSDLLGSRMDITINPRDIEALKASPPDISETIFLPTPDGVVEELRKKAPVFKEAWDEGSQTIDDFYHFPPVMFFRNNFVTGWDALLDLIKNRRATR
jgi:transaldolase